MSSTLRRARDLAARLLPGFIMLVVLLGAWEWTSRARQSPFLPRLSLIAESFRDEWLFERVSVDLVPSLGRLFAGYFLSLVIGVAAGIAIGTLPWFSRATAPSVEFLRSLPTSALVPFAIIAFGIGFSGKVFLITFAGTWPVLLNVAAATAAIDPLRMDVAAVFGLPRHLRLRKVLLPAMTPALLAGARTSLAIALIMVVVSEMFGSVDGIGHFVLQAERTFRIADMWSGVVMIGLLGYALNTVFVVIERLTLRRHGRAGAAPTSRKAETAA